MAVKTSAEILSDAYDAASGGETHADAEVEAPATAPDAEPEASTQDAETTQEAAPEATMPPEAQPGAGKKPTQAKPGKADTITQPPAQAAPSTTLKAPQSWPAKAREHWNKLPPEVQQVVDKRDREVVKALAASADSRRTVEALNATLEPFLPGLRALGVAPLPAINELLQTHHVLRSGTKDERAALVAGLIDTFDVDVPTLASVIKSRKEGQGEQPKPPPQQQKAETFRDPEFAAFKASIQRAAQQKQAQQFQAAKSEYEAFAASGEAEFLNDEIREDMAELLKLPKNQGLSVQKLYEKACLLNDDVRPLYEQRKAAKAAATARASTQPRTRAVSSSVRHEPTAPPNGARPTSRREQLEQNWDKLSR